MGAPMQTIMPLGGVEDPGGRKDVHGGRPQMEVHQVRRNPVASVGRPGRQGAGVQGPQGQYPRPLALVGKDRDQLCPGRRCTTSWGKGYDSPGCRQEKRPHRLPRPQGGGVFRSLASEVAAMRGVKLHRQEMVKNMIVGMGEAMRSLQGGDEGLLVLTEVLRRVRDGGDLEEEDDGYYSSSDDEGPVTAQMAARGVGEAGCVVVADSIWNRLVPRDLLRVYSAAQREWGEETTAPAKSGPVDSMLESLRVDTGACT